MGGWAGEGPRWVDAWGTSTQRDSPGPGLPCPTLGVPSEVRGLAPCLASWEGKGPLFSASVGGVAMSADLGLGGPVTEQE